jgi:hypothetical protein
MTPITAEKALYEDLLSIYARAGAEVSYETDKGETKAYWAKRFLQAVKRSGKQEELFELVDRLVGSDEPSRGFYILKKAERLDLTVEALVVDAEKSYHEEFDPEIVERAKRRLAEHHEDRSDQGVAPAVSEPASEETAATLSRVLKPGETFDLRVRVGEDGTLSLALI